MSIPSLRVVIIAIVIAIASSGVIAHRYQLRNGLPIKGGEVPQKEDRADRSAEFVPPNAVGRSGHHRRLQQQR
jgi:hypothetical protein